MLPVLDPRLGEAVQTQEFFQVLESREPSLSQMPLRAENILGFRVPKPSKSLKKSRCARPEDDP